MTTQNTPTQTDSTTSRGKVTIGDRWNLITVLGGLGFSAFHLIHVYEMLEFGLFGIFIEGFIPLVLALGIVAAGPWLQHRGYTPEERKRVVLWMAFVSILTGLLFLWALSHQLLVADEYFATDAYGGGSGHSLTEVFPHAQFVTVTNITVGALIGLVLGIYNVKSHRHQDTLRSFKQAVEYTGHSVVITDTDGQIEYVNPTVEKMTGYSKEEVLGENPRLWKSGEHPPEFYESMWDVILSGETFKAEVINTDKDGNNFTINQTISPIFDDEGNITRFVAVYNDVTALKARERQLREEKRRVDRLQQRLTVLNRVLRHDIRTAVTVILGNIELLERDEVEREPLEEIEQRAQQLHSIAEEARSIEQTLSRTDTQTETDITSTLEDVAATLRAEYPDARVDVEVPDTALASVSSEIDAAFKHVLTNAVEHNDSETPEITVTGVQQNGELQIEVADNGPGIPEAELEPLREGRETQLQHTSGLGLWQTLWIVQDSDGTITFDENEPRGTVVTITLPIR